MDNKQFEALERALHNTLDKAAVLQQKYVEETGKLFKRTHPMPPSETHEEAKDDLIFAFHRFKEINDTRYAEHKATWRNQHAFDSYGWYMREVERDLNIIEGWLASIEREFTNLEDEPNATEVCGLCN